MNFIIRGLFLTRFLPFRWHKRCLPHHPEVSRELKKKGSCVFRSDRVGPCRASICSSSFLEMPPRNQTKSGGGTWACYTQLLSCYTLLSYGLMVMEQFRLHPAVSHKWLRFPLSIISHGRGQTLLNVSACWASGVPKPICQFLTTISTVMLFFRLRCSVTSHPRLTMSSWNSC